MAGASLRIGDAERDAALAELGRHFAEGRLTQPEHDERASRALAARTEADLDTLFADLPPAAGPAPRSFASRDRPTLRLRPLLLLPLAVPAVVILAHALPVLAFVAVAFVLSRFVFGFGYRARYPGCRRGSYHW